jgi:hypothetical protein
MFHYSNVIKILLGGISLMVLSLVDHESLPRLLYSLFIKLHINIQCHFAGVIFYTYFYTDQVESDASEDCESL